MAGVAGVAPDGLAAAPESPSLEYQVKAAFLLNFTKFVDWPETGSGDVQARVTICIPEEDPFAGALDKMVEGENVNGRKLTVQRIRNGETGSCQVLFLGHSMKDIPGMLERAGHGVLTVGEEASFLRDGGMIAFVIENRRVRFDVKLSAAAAGGIRISSKLLKVARYVAK